MFSGHLTLNSGHLTIKHREHGNCSEIILCTKMEGFQIIHNRVMVDKDDRIYRLGKIDLLDQGKAATTFFSVVYGLFSEPEKENEFMIYGFDEQTMDP